MAEDTLTASDVEGVFEGLGRQDRLDLLERLIRGETATDAEALTTEERIERLEKSTWGKGRGCCGGSGPSSSRGERRCGCC